jgi:hypothetical protein
MSGTVDEIGRGRQPASGVRARRLGFAVLALAAGAAAALATARVGAQPTFLAAGSAVGLAGLAGVGKRAAP